MLAARAPEALVVGVGVFGLITAIVLAEAGLSAEKFSSAATAMRWGTWRGSRRMHGLVRRINEVDVSGSLSALLFPKRAAVR